MRVIAGKAGSIPLKTLPSKATRPTTDRIKETLFNMIKNDVPGRRFLDLFAGSGGIGIEALSRGASECVFVEKNKRAADIIRDNLKATGLLENALVVLEDCFSFLETNKKNSHSYDIIFMDPPYDHEFEKRTLTILSSSDMVSYSTTIIVECSLNTDFPYAGELGFEIARIKKYKTNAHVFIKRKQGDES